MLEMSTGVQRSGREKNRVETIKLRTHVGTDGKVVLPLPHLYAGQDVEVVVVLQPVAKHEPGKTPEDLGWPPGYFEQTYGSFRDTTLERPEQGAIEVREPLG
jgi:hypothetical protein